MLDVEFVDSVNYPNPRIDEDTTVSRRHHLPTNSSMGDAELRLVEDLSRAEYENEIIRDKSKAIGNVRSALGQKSAQERDEGEIKGESKEIYDD